MKKIIALLLLAMTGFFHKPSVKNQSFPCFTENKTCWQLYSYRNNINNTEDSRPNFQYTGRGFKNLRVMFIDKKEGGGGKIKGHSLSSSFIGGFTYKGDHIKVNQLIVFPMGEYRWGLDSLQAVFRNCSSYSCQGDSLYLNYYNDNHTAVFFKTDSLQ